MKKLLTILLFLPLVLSAQRKNLIFESTFEKANPFTYWNNIDAVASYSVTLSGDFARAGKYSARFEVRNTDAPIASGTRAEISLPYDTAQLIERWYGVSIYLPLDYIPDPCSETLWQLHANSNCGSPPVALGTYNGYWVYNINYDTGANHASQYQNILINKHVPGTWTDYVVHVKWDDGSHKYGMGITQIWQNGVLITNRTGKNDYVASPGCPLFYNGGHYLKTGCYKWPYSLGWGCSTTKRIVYIDEVRVGNPLATYNDVAPEVPGMIIVPIRFESLVFLKEKQALQWTVYEDNADPFEVQESYDGIHWETVATVQSKCKEGQSGKFTYTYSL